MPGTPEELIDEYLATKRLKRLRSTEEPWAITRSFVRVFLNDLCNNYAIRIDRVPYFDIIDDPRPNARAWWHPSVDFIGIYAGEYVLLSDTFKRILSQPDAFTDIGRADNEIISGLLQTPPNNAVDIFLCRDATELAIAPRDPLRRAYATVLVHMSLMFIVLHEFGHIQHGHCQYGSSSGIVEASQENDPVAVARTVSYRTLQTLEWDADAFAATTLLAYMVGQFEEGEPPRNPFFTSINNILISWTRAVCIAIHIWMGRSQREYNLTTATHPPSSIRMADALNVATTRGSKLLGWDPNRMSALLAPAVKEIIDAYAALDGSAPDYDSLGRALGLGGVDTWSIRRGYEEEWVTLHAELKQFARLPLDPPNPQAMERRAARKPSV